MKTIAITGVTGHLGGAIARELSDKGITTRHLARRPEKAEKLPNSTVYQAFYDKSVVTLEALTGVEVLFMVSARESKNRLQEHKELIDAAVLAGVKHIVYTSFYNASSTSTFTLGRDHAATESYIREQGLTYTFVRDNFYMDFFVDLCLEYGEIKGPAGNGKVSAVVRNDVAAVLARILEHPEAYENQILNMTGPQDLTMSDIVTIVGSYLGKRISYIEETIDEAYASRKAWPAEDWEYDSWVSTYTAIAKGEQSGVSLDIERILGRPATSLEDYLQSRLPK